MKKLTIRCLIVAMAFGVSASAADLNLLSLDDLIENLKVERPLLKSNPERKSQYVDRLVDLLASNASASAESRIAALTYLIAEFTTKGDIDKAIELNRELVLQDELQSERKALCYLNLANLISLQAYVQPERYSLDVVLETYKAANVQIMALDLENSTAHPASPTIFQLSHRLPDFYYTYARRLLKGGENAAAIEAFEALFFKTSFREELPAKAIQSALTLYSLQLLESDQFDLSKYLQFTHELSSLEGFSLSKALLTVVQNASLNENLYRLLEAITDSKVLPLDEFFPVLFEYATLLYQDDKLKQSFDYNLILLKKLAENRSSLSNSSYIEKRLCIVNLLSSIAVANNDRELGKRLQMLLKQEQINTKSTHN